MKRTLSLFLAMLLLICCGAVSCGRSDVKETTATTSDTDATTAGTDATTANTSAQTTTAATESAAENPDARDPSVPLNILFIGNSYTHYNTMPTAIFQPIARAAGYTVQVHALTEGGYHLWEFADPLDAKGADLRHILNGVKKKFDVVILQEQSNTPISNPQRFYSGVRDMCALIYEHNPDAEIVLYATWGYQKGHADLTKYGKTTQEMEMKLRAAYTAIGEEMGLKVAYAGAGMTYAMEHSTIGLYNADRTHPSPAGSTLAAMTLFSAIFRVHPGTLGDTTVISADALTAVREAVTYVYENGAPVDAAYKTSSVGVSYEAPTFTSGIDIGKTKNLTAAPASSIISYITRDSAETGNGWQKLKSNAQKTFSGLRGDKDQIASTSYTTAKLTDAQKADVGDIGYGVSVIGLESVRTDKKGTNTAVENLVNGHWGTSFMAAMTFDDKKYDIKGNVTEGDGFTALITLNFGDKRTFDAIGYFSGSLEGFPQVQEVFVSDDGVSWTRVDSACYDAVAMAAQGKKLVSVSAKPADPWNGNTASVQCLFDMGGVSGKYIRIGIRLGGDVDSVGIQALPAQQRQTINTREIVVYGK